MPETSRTLVDTLGLVNNVLHAMTGFKRVPRSKLRPFAVDITLVALGVRTGHLFDSFSLDRRASPTQLFTDFVDKLRDAAPSFDALAVLTDTESSDVFFVNVPLLQRRLEQSDLPVFIGLRSQLPPAILSQAPEGLNAQLDELRDICHEQAEGKYPAFIQTSASVAPQDAIPLAAVLLEYPVAYAPDSSSSAPFLTNVDMEVFTCSISLEESLDARHTLMQFSCPSSLLHDIGDMAEHLRERLGSRLRAAGVSQRLDVSSRTERLDRVAL